MFDVIVLIVNWNVRDLLRGCLHSVMDEMEDIQGEVWVVDNASHDGSAEMVRTEFPSVHLTASPRNLGFAGGNNLALRQMTAAPPRYVWLLNPDTQVEQGALRTLMGFMDAHPEVGVAGPALLYGDGSFQHSAFGFPGLGQILFDLFPMPARWYDSRLNGRYPRAWYERGRPFPVDHPLGAAMMVRWAVTQVGLLDERFHMYCEEIDWCMRIKRAGWAIYCVPAARVIHYAGQSTRQIQVASFVNLWQSRRRLYEKHYPPLKRWLAERLVRAGLRWKIRAARQSRLPAAQIETQVQALKGALALFEG